jgi:hypothetical protein
MDSRLKLCLVSWEKSKLKGVPAGMVCQLFAELTRSDSNYSPKYLCKVFLCSKPNKLANLRNA